MTDIEILGFDEVGRGSLAGPVVVACVLGNHEIQKPDNLIIRDSKLMSCLQREKASTWIRRNLYYGIGLSNATEIDTLGIVESVKKAANSALKDIRDSFPAILNMSYKLQNDGGEKWFENSKAIIKGDTFVTEISMASIIAKVYRDNLMYGFKVKYPNWGFETHVGYGTTKHIEMITTCGLQEGLHRASFCTRLIRKR